MSSFVSVLTVKIYENILPFFDLKESEKSFDWEGSTQPNMVHLHDGFSIVLLPNEYNKSTAHHWVDKRIYTARLQGTDNW